MKNIISSSDQLLSCVQILQPQALQHARHPYPSPSHRAWSNSCPSSQWCHATISSFVIHFSSCLQSFSASQSFSNESALRIMRPKYWSFSFSISPSNEHLGLISFRWLVGSPCSPRDSQESSPTPQFKSTNFWCSAFFIVQFSHSYMTIEKLWKNHSFDQTDLCQESNASVF